jgi:hypothetical protein
MISSLQNKQRKHNMKPTTITLDSRVVRQPETIAAPMGEHLMMMNIQQGFYYDLNPTARFIWQILETPQQVREVCRLLQAEFEVAAEQCEHAVVNFVNKLVAESVVLIVSD